MLHRESVTVLVCDAAFVTLCERLNNNCFIITFVLEIELFVPRILSKVARKAPYPPITVIQILCKYCDI